LPYTYEYPRPCVTADALVFRFTGGRLEILLIKRNHYPFEGMWALPGGFVDMDEPVETAAARELNEEAGLGGIELRQLGAYGRPGRDPRARIIAVAYYGFAPPPLQAARMGPGNWGVRAGDDARDACWFPAGRLPKTAFDHDVIVGDAVAAIRRAACFGLEHCKMLGRTFSREDFLALHLRIFGGGYDVEGLLDGLLERGNVRLCGKDKYILNKSR
jgi:8-oxo-dGTP diphosphatase